MNKWWIYALSVIFFAIIIATEPLYRQPLFDKSLTYIENLQNQSPFILKLWSVYSIAILVVILVPHALWYVLHAGKTHAFYYVTMILVFAFTQNMMKMIYHEPRPYWVSEKIMPMKCHTGFGNPSGHAMFGTGVPLIIWLDWVTGEKRTTTGWRKYGLNAGLLLLAVVVAGTTSYSRLILGVHSAN